MVHFSTDEAHILVPLVTGLGVLCYCVAWVSVRIPICVVIDPIYTPSNNCVGVNHHTGISQCRPVRVYIFGRKIFAGYYNYNGCIWPTMQVWVHTVMKTRLWDYYHLAWFLHTGPGTSGLVEVLKDLEYARAHPLTPRGVNCHLCMCVSHHLCRCVKHHLCRCVYYHLC